MSKRIKLNEGNESLPEPVALDPEQVRQIAAGTASALPASLTRPIVIGIIWDPGLGSVAQLGAVSQS